MKVEVPFLDLVLSRFWKSHKLEVFLITLEFSIWKIDIMEIFIRNNLLLKVITKRISNLMEINVFETFPR